jgi:hypothetical protein
METRAFSSRYEGHRDRCASERKDPLRNVQTRAFMETRNLKYSRSEFSRAGSGVSEDLKSQRRLARNTSINLLDKLLNV